MTNQWIFKNLTPEQESDQNKRMIAEARFLRATQYHYLASYFKDVPLVTTVLSGEEANTVKRSTQSEILAWCATEFKEAAADLPRFKDLASSETGRACKQAALAFLGRTCMLQKDWASGAAAYKEIIDYGDNDIHTSYPELFWPGTGVGNKENIFYIAYLENYFGCGMPQQVLPAKDGGWSLSNPSAGLFESYEFVDGTPFSYDDPRDNPNNLGENLELKCWGGLSEANAGAWMLMQDVEDRFWLYKFSLESDNFRSIAKIEVTDAIAPHMKEAVSFAANPEYNDVFMYATKDAIYSFAANQLTQNTTSNLEVLQQDMDQQNMEVTGIKFVNITVPDPTASDPNATRASSQVRCCVRDLGLSEKQGGVVFYEVNSTGGIHLELLFERCGFCDRVIDIDEKYS